MSKPVKRRRISEETTEKVRLRGAHVQTNVSDEVSSEDESVDEDQLEVEHDSADELDEVDEDDSIADEEDSGAAEEDEGQNPSVQRQLRQISFGALIEAQGGVQPRRRPTTINPSSAAEKVQILRERLAELKRVKKDKPGDKSSSPGSRDTSRSSKHAPTEQSSKRAVTRKRPAIEVSSNPYHARDPRFSAISGTVNDEAMRRNYSFLDEYRDKEIAELKEVIKKVKDLNEKERLQRQVMAMENQARANRERERQRKVIQEHKKQERELVKEGKKPFFLKQNEVKKRVLVDKFENMKGKEREKAMKRKRTKESQREKRKMPNPRRSDG